VAAWPINVSAPTRLRWRRTVRFQNASSPKNSAIHASRTTTFHGDGRRKTRTNPAKRNIDRRLRPRVVSSRNGHFRPLGYFLACRGLLAESYVASTGDGLVDPLVNSRSRVRCCRVARRPRHPLHPSRAVASRSASCPLCKPEVAGSSPARSIDLRSRSLMDASGVGRRRLPYGHARPLERGWQAWARSWTIRRAPRAGG
jgi:hypothetical protein